MPVVAMHIANWGLSVSVHSGQLFSCQCERTMCNCTSIRVFQCLSKYKSVQASEVLCEEFFEGLRRALLTNNGHWT